MKLFVLLSLVLTANSFAARGIISSEDAKKINIKALAGKYEHKKGFGIEVIIESNDPNSAQGDLFKPALDVNYEVEIILNDKASYMSYDEVYLLEGTPYVSVDDNGNIEMSIREDDCQDPECTDVVSDYMFSPNNSKKKYALDVFTEISNDAEQGIEENGLESNPIEYCEMFFESVLYIENISEYDGRTCSANATYYLRKK